MGRLQRKGREMKGGKMRRGELGRERKLMEINKIKKRKKGKGKKA